MSATWLGWVMRADARLVYVKLLEGPQAGQIRPCALRGKLWEEASSSKSPVAVGDRVAVTLDGDPPGVERVEPRRNLLSRVASSHDSRAQILFANVDQLVNVASVVQPKFSSNRTDRILAACRWHGIPVVLALNKIDLAQPEDIAALRKTYLEAEVEVLEVSAKTGAGLEQLRARLNGRISALYGGSGVGKSTLLNALDARLKLKIGKISRFWDQGKHTTSNSQVIELDEHTAVIDTPGIRVFRLHECTRDQLRLLFPEFLRVQSRCRLRDCSHDHEPQCAVFEAVEQGRIAPTRYASYLEILDEISKPREPEDEPPPE